METTVKCEVDRSGSPPLVLSICGLKVRFLPGSPLSANDVRAIDRLVEALRLIWNGRGAANVVEKAERLMIGHSPRSRLTVFLLFMLTASRVWAQGPPYQTDDPTPVDFHHYEFYVFGTVSSTPLETDPVGPAFEFNWGAVPNVQIHAVLPFGAVRPSNGPGETELNAYGLNDVELGVKYGFIKQTKHRPQIGTFPMLEIPTGSSAKGLGVGQVWYKLPLWVEKDLGAWTIDGGAGYAIVRQDGYRSFPYGGFLAKRELGKKLELAAEIFAHAAEGLGTPHTGSSTLIDAGGYYHFKSPGLQLLFAYGHSIAGQRENYAYLGLYRTWARNKETDKAAARNPMLSTQPHGY